MIIEFASWSIFIFYYLIKKVKKFLNEKALDYNVEVIYSGGDPQFFIMDNKGNDLEIFKLEKLTHDQIGDLLETKGFGKYKNWI